MYGDKFIIDCIPLTTPLSFRKIKVIVIAKNLTVVPTPEGPAVGSAEPFTAAGFAFNSNQIIFEHAYYFVN